MDINISSSRNHCDWFVSTSGFEVKQVEEMSRYVMAILIEKGYLPKPSMLDIIDKDNELHFLVFVKNKKPTLKNDLWEALYEWRSKNCSSLRI